MLDKTVTIRQASEATGIPEEWLLARVPLADRRDVPLRDVIEAANHYPRDEHNEHARMARLRYEK